MSDRPAPKRKSDGTWAKGYSGNVNGRREGKTLRKLIESKMSYEKIAGILADCAEAKEPWAVKEVLDRLEPKDQKLTIEAHAAAPERPRVQVSAEWREKLARLMAESDEQRAAEGKPPLLPATTH